MGSIIGGLVSGVGGIVGSSMQADAAGKAARYQMMGQEQAAQLALTGYRWLNTTGMVNPYLANGNAGVAAEAPIMAQEGANTDVMQRLLGLKPDTPVPNSDGSQMLGPNGQQIGPAGQAFQNYLNSTGYQFQLNQGMDAVTGSAAAKGLLNSGSTLRALQQYGQGLGSTYFNNYLGQIGAANTQLGGMFSQANTQSQQGLSTIGLIAAAGSQGGAGAANAVTQGSANAGNAFIQQGNAQAGGIVSAANNFGKAIGSGFDNFFGSGNTGANAPTSGSNFFGGGSPVFASNNQDATYGLF